MKLLSLYVLFFALSLFGCSSPAVDVAADQEQEPDDPIEQDEFQIDSVSNPILVIKPYEKNLRYWEYNNQPVLLLGATNNDNLFQSEDKKEQLDLLSAVGGNYIRNTMSSRDEGDVWPFFLQDDGLYDLERWNEEYWNRFEELLKLTEEREIIVQIEIWDRFDFSQDPWKANPFNPKNNVNYSAAQSGLSEDYTQHPAGDQQPFFHSIEGMPRFTSQLNIVRAFQETFVRKFLSYSLNYGHVLYCMNNETNTPSEWGKYWLRFVKNLAGEREIYATDMFDLFFYPMSCIECQSAISDPEVYTFIDASQVNNRNQNQTHWDTLRWVIEERDKYDLRPTNSVKVYGPFRDPGYNSGVKRFCRDIIGGFAAARFHRPDFGNGLNSVAISTIKAIRKIETVVCFWDIEVRQDLLSDREDDEAYIAAKEGEDYVLLFNHGGKVKLDLVKYSGKYYGRWIDIEKGEWAERFEIDAGSLIEISAPRSGGWFAVITDYDAFN